MKKGFTLVELLVSLVLITILSLALFKTVVNIQEKQMQNIAINKFKAFEVTLNSEIEQDFLKDKITEITECGKNCYNIEYKNRGTVKISIDTDNNTITYGTLKEKIPDDYKLYGELSMTKYESDIEGVNSFVYLDIPINSSLEPSKDGLKYMYVYDKNESNLVADLPEPEPDPEPEIATEKIIDELGNCGVYLDENSQYRYSGKDVCNYVKFNNETWRIIGVFDTEKTADGTKEKRLKIIKDTPIGKSIWGTSTSEPVWNTSTIQTGLNGSYALGTSWLGASLNAQAQSMVDDVLWYVNSHSSSSRTASQMYGIERSGATFLGKFGLMYPSDYGYASEACKDGSFRLNGYSNESCSSSNWMFTGTGEWTIIPNIPNSAAAYDIVLDGSVRANSGISNNLSVRPTVYLKPDIYITSGDGTIDKPYNLNIVSDSGIYTCVAGKYLKANQKTCSECEIDHYCDGGDYPFNPDEDQGIKECPENSHSVAGSSSCSCPTPTGLLADKVGTGGLYQDEYCNLRYAGSNSNVKNYVTFNNETWRIIGVLNIEKTIGGTKEKRLKIIRDSSTSTTSYGSNNSWSTSSINTTLNGTFYNGLNTTAKNMIDNAVWHTSTGGPQYTPFTKYFQERSGNDNAWVGKIGLMNASDYGYASSGCAINQEVLSYYATSCKDTDWLYNGEDTWTINSYGWDAVLEITALNVWGPGNVIGGQYSNTSAVRPTIYLNSNVKITGGDGSSSNPYTLGT